MHEGRATPSIDAPAAQRATVAQRPASAFWDLLACARVDQDARTRSWRRRPRVVRRSRSESPVFLDVMFVDEDCRERVERHAVASFVNVADGSVHVRDFDGEVSWPD